MNVQVSGKVLERLVVLPDDAPRYSNGFGQGRNLESHAGKFDVLKHKLGTVEPEQEPRSYFLPEPVFDSQNRRGLPPQNGALIPVVLLGHEGRC